MKASHLTAEVLKTISVSGELERIMYLCYLRAIQEELTLIYQKEITEATKLKLRAKGLKIAKLPKTDSPVYLITWNI